MLNKIFWLQYIKCKSFAVPSWFETTGLVYLEAVVAGCTSVVASGDRAFEYLDKNGIYCDPGSLSLILKGFKNCTKQNTVSTNFKKRLKFYIPGTKWPNKPYRCTIA